MIEMAPSDAQASVIYWYKGEKHWDADAITPQMIVPLVDKISQVLNHEQGRIKLMHLKKGKMPLYKNEH